jgi:hypothetical protein
MSEPNVPGKDPPAHLVSAAAALERILSLKYPEQHWIVTVDDDEERIAERRKHIPAMLAEEHRKRDAEDGRRREAKRARRAAWVAGADRIVPAEVAGQSPEKQPICGQSHGPVGGAPSRQESNVQGGPNLSGES